MTKNILSASTKVLFTIPIVITFSTLFFHAIVYARWATKDDASVEYKSFNRNIVVNQDGTYEEIIEIRAKALNEIGRNELGVMRFKYNNNVSNITILEAKTINGTQEIKVAQDSIEKKPLASDNKGFDQHFQIMVSFPKFTIGSEIYIKIKEKLFKTSIPNYFTQVIDWQKRGCHWRQTNIVVKSLLPLNINVNDPHNRIDVKKKNEGQYQVINILQKKEFSEYVVMEDGELIDRNVLTWVELSSAKDYITPGNFIAQKYNQILEDKLPPIFKEIKDKASDIKNEIEKFNTITSELAKNIRYMGDWRTTEGQIIPRKLSVIAASGFGDCKDFAAATAAILRSLGYKAETALIYRGYPYISSTANHLPSMTDFNHAIVRLINEKGEKRYIDTTNFASMADGTFEDIANREVLVLTKNGVILESTPNINYKHNIVKKNVSIAYNSNLASSYIECNMQLRGESAYYLTGALLKTSEQVIKDYLIGPRGYNIKTALPDLRSRIVKDLDFKYSYDNESSPLLTNYGVGILLPIDSLNKIVEARNDEVGDILLMTPRTLISKTLLKNYRAKNAHILNYTIKTKWFNFYREYKNTKDGLEISETLELLRDFIRRYETKTSEFKTLKQNAIKNIAQTLIVEKILEKE